MTFPSEWFSSIMSRLSRRWPPTPQEIDTAIIDDMEQSSRERLRASTCKMLETSERALHKLKPSNGHKHT